MHPQQIGARDRRRRVDLQPHLLARRQQSHRSGGHLVVLTDGAAHQEELRRVAKLDGVEEGLHQWNTRPASMTTVWPVIVSVLHMVTAISAQSSLSAAFFSSA